MSEFMCYQTYPTVELAGQMARRLKADDIKTSVVAGWLMEDREVWDKLVDLGRFSAAQMEIYLHAVRARNAVLFVLADDSEQSRVEHILYSQAPPA